MKFLILLSALFCAVVAQYTYHSCAQCRIDSNELRQNLDSLYSNYDYMNEDMWANNYPFDYQWTGAMQQFSSYFEYGNQYGMADEEFEQLKQHVEYRNNYEGYYDSNEIKLRKMKDDIRGNWTFVRQNIESVFCELDATLKLVQEVLYARPECGSSDVMNFLQTKASDFYMRMSQNSDNMRNTQQYYQNGMGFFQIGGWEQLFQKIFEEPGNSVMSLQRSERIYFEPAFAMITKQLDNYAETMYYEVFLNTLFELTRERTNIINLYHDAATVECFDPTRYNDY